LLSFDQMTGPLGVVVNLLTNKVSFADNAGMTFSQIEDLQGSAYADSLTGSNGNNILMGGAGADSLYGLAGNDTLIGGAQGDWLDGGAGADVFVFVAVSDSAGPSGLGTISGFQANVDVINLAAIDAVPGGGGRRFYLHRHSGLHRSGA
jgi:Ca2+-binding RTX toxin-like protein